MLTISLVLNLILICEIHILKKQKKKLQDDKHLMLQYVKERLRKKRGMTITEIRSITKRAFEYPDEFRRDLENLKREFNNQKRR